MKHVFLLIAALLLGCEANAENIGQSEALQKAKAFLQQRNKSVSQDNKATRQTSDEQPYYAFNATDGGFVIVSGSDRTDAVIGYSDSGTFDEDNMPSNLKAWLDEYKRQIEYVEANKIDAVSKQTRAASMAAIQPLVKTTWGQNTPYNDLCPSVKVSGEKQTCPTGCVATAMAQILKYHEWPQNMSALPAYTTKTRNISMPALSATTFDWSNMANSYAGTTTVAQQNAVAKLMLYCGQSVEMDYQPAGSGTNVFSSTFTEYFNYDEATAFDASRDFYTTSEWESLLYGELSKGRPLYYAGGVYNGDGHAFICDGYDGNGYWHINWGWNGSSDGYFKLSVMNPENQGTGGSSASEGYTMSQYVVGGLQPNKNGVNSQALRATAYSISLQGSNVFTRSSKSSDFKNIKVEYQLANWTGQDFLLEHGLALYKDGVFVKNIYTSSKNISFENDYYYTIPVTFSMGAGLSDGTYSIRSISRQYGSSEWLLCHNGVACDITAVISNGTVLTLKASNSTSETGMSCKVNSVQYGGKLRANGATTITANITNTSKVNVCDLYVFIDDVLSAGNTAMVDANCSGDVEFHFMPTTSGKKTVKIALDSKCENVVYTGSVTISADYAVSLSMGTITVTKSVGSTFDFTISAKNIGLNKYDNNILANIFRAEDASYVTSQSRDAQIAVGSTGKANFSIENLPSGKYIVQAFYYSKGQKVILCTEYGLDFTYSAATAVSEVEAETAGKKVDVFTIGGVKVRSQVDADEATDNLPSGIYLIDGKKVYVK